MTLTINWLKAAGIRAVKTAAQSAIAAIPMSTVIYELDWIFVGGMAASAAVLSLLTSLAGLPEVTEAEEIKAEGTE